MRSKAAGSSGPSKRLDAPGRSSQRPALENEWVVIGSIVGPHGVQGEVRVVPASDVPGRLEELGEVTLALPNGQLVSATAETARPHRGKGVYLLRFPEYRDREAARQLRNARLVVPCGESPELPEGEYYDWQILGLRAVTTDGRDLGQVRQILRTGANDVYVTDGGLLPAIRDVIRSVDVDAGKIVVEPVPGLLE